MLSIANQLLIEAHDRGYHVVAGEVFYKDKNRKLIKQLVKGNIIYYRFSYRSPQGKQSTIKVHRLVAYQKYGDKLFEPGMEVRHRNGDSMDNSESNILLGTKSENQMDKTKETRTRMALAATEKIKVHDHDAILKRRKEGATFGELMNEFGITSKGTVSYIINKCYSLVSSSLVQEN
jgi:hypothetical protein